MHLDHLPADASPVSVSQPALIRLYGPAKAIALDVLRVNSLQTGAYVSRFRGRGMEFDESRPYQPGDDPRSIDWRVTARSTTAYTKLFREERERPVLLLVDLRSNMHFATRGCFKSVNASRAAALIAWAAHHRGDRLGGLIFGDTVHRELKPRLGRQAALRFVHALAEHPDWQQRERSADDAGEAALTMAMSALKVEPGRPRRSPREGCGASPFPASPMTTTASISTPASAASIASSAARPPSMPSPRPIQSKAARAALSLTRRSA